MVGNIVYVKVLYSLQLFFFMFSSSLTVGIAIIGSSENASVYAKRFASAGHEVYMSPEKADSKVHTDFFYDNLHVCGIEDASKAADIIIIATAPTNVREVAYWMGDVRGKVIIDASADFAEGDEQVNTIGAIKAITGSSNVVKIFCTEGYEQLLMPLLKNDKTHLILVGENPKARQAAKIIARDMDIYSFIDLGGFEALPLFDSLANCWRDLAKKNKTEKRISA